MKVDKNKNLVDWPFGKKNYILFTVSLLTIIFGYFLMWSGEVNSFQSVKVAPKILTIGYLVLIPLSILYKD